MTPGAKASRRAFLGLGAFGIVGAAVAVVRPAMHEYVGDPIGNPASLQ